MEQGPLSFPWPLGIQLALPDSFQSDRAFGALLDVLREEQFSELELGIPDTALVQPACVQRFLSAWGFRLTRLATGAAAKRHGLSLSSPEGRTRARSVERCISMIAWAAEIRAEVIIGILKGVPGPDDTSAGPRLQRSMEDLSRRLGRSPVAVLLEVTHRGECPAITTPQEAAAAIAPFPDFGWRVLLDTYHLARQGLAVAGTLASAPDLRGSLHCSDDNRRLPGLGRMRFGPILEALQVRGYAGSLVLEGAFGPDPCADVRESAAYLRREAR